jgi:hypothetical protein
MIMGPIHRPNQGFGWAKMAPVRAADNEPEGNGNVPVNRGKFGFLVSNKRHSLKSYVI